MRAAQLARKSCLANDLCGLGLVLIAREQVVAGRWHPDGRIRRSVISDLLPEPTRWPRLPGLDDGRVEGAEFVGVADG